MRGLLFRAATPTAAANCVCRAMTAYRSTAAQREPTARRGSLPRTEVPLRAATAATYRSDIAPSTKQVSGIYPHNEPFEDENPFDTEPERVNSEESSAFKVNLSEPSSPPPQALRLPSSPPASNSTRPPFPSPGSHRQPQAYKDDYCCTRDQWLHSGEDVEILVLLRFVGLCVATDSNLIDY